MAQPRQLVCVAQLVGVDDLVKDRAESAVHRRFVGAPARHLSGTARTARIVVARTGHDITLACFGGVLRVLGLAFRGRAVGRVLGTRSGTLTLALVLPGGFLAALLFALRLVVGLAELEIEIPQQLAGRPRVGVLIEDCAIELAEILADAAFQPRTPEIDDTPRRRR